MVSYGKLKMLYKNIDWSLGTYAKGLKNRPRARCWQ
jgi:hypothetical protein